MKKIKKIMLIVPPHTIPVGSEKRVSPPLGLAYLASTLLQNGYKVLILDSLIEGFENIYIKDDRLTWGLSWQDIRKKIEVYSPDVVGVSCLFTEQRKNAYKLCEVVKDIDFSIITVMGGVHPTVMPEETLGNPYVDYIILGEGEEKFLNLLNYLNENKNINSIDGVGFKYNGKIIVNPHKDFISNLDNIPFPAWDLLPMNEYNKINKATRFPVKLHPAFPVIASRCCPGKCNFCSTHLLWGKKYRTRSSENVIKEIKYLVDNYGIKEIFFWDDNFAHSNKRIIDIFEGLKKIGISLPWSMSNGVALYSLNESFLEKIREYGCYKITFTVESGSKRVLKEIIHKPFTELEKLKPIIDKSKELGFQTAGVFIIGFPGETMKEIQETIDYAKELDFDYVGFSIAIPYPGTELYKECQEKSLFVKDFSLDNLYWGKGHITTPDFTPEILEQIRIKAWNEINFSNKDKIKRVATIMQVSEQEIENIRLNTLKKLKEKTNE